MYFICRRPSLSQKLSELAQHVDFREGRTDDDNDREEGKKKQEEEEEEGVSGPTTKKPSHRWPWEFTHSKLKYINNNNNNNNNKYMNLYKQEV